MIGCWLESFKKQVSDQPMKYESKLHISRGQQGQHIYYMQQGHQDVCNSKHLVQTLLFTLPVDISFILRGCSGITHR